MAVEQSIFKATKLMLDIAPGDDSFDGQVMGFINSALSDLVDLGIGPVEGIQLEDDTVTWESLEEPPDVTERVKNWIYLKVRLLWDPPQTSFLLEAHSRQIEEATWRLVNRRDGDRWVIANPDYIPDEEIILGGGGP